MSCHKVTSSLPGMEQGHLPHADVSVQQDLLPVYAKSVGGGRREEGALAELSLAWLRREEEATAGSSLLEAALQPKAMPGWGICQGDISVETESRMKGPSDMVTH